MRWLKGKPGGVLVFLIISALVIGGLGWVTVAVMEMERAQIVSRAEAQAAERMRLALWRLELLVSPYLAQENSRRFNHYSSIYAPPVSFDNFGQCIPPGMVLQASPLLDADLPPWMLLHFQIQEAEGWASPQVPNPTLLTCLRNDIDPSLPDNATGDRRKLFNTLAAVLSPRHVIDTARTRTTTTWFRDRALIPMGTEQLAEQQQPAQQALQQPNASQTAYTQNPVLEQEFNQRFYLQSRMQQEQQNPRRYNKDLVLGNTTNFNGMNWLNTNPKKITHGENMEVRMTPVVSIWVTDSANEEHLLAVRLVQLDEKEVCQGVLLDARALEELLLAEVRDLFPRARLLPVREAIPPRPEQTMTALPFELDPNEEIAYVSPGWTALRIGLALAWAASLLALGAVGLGGWSLLNLSERRMRFVSAVTHELRTPMTTLRLYLDMLVGGMVRDEQQRMDYLATLHAETDRLNRLIANVLDYSKLEGQRCRLVRTEVKVTDLIRSLEEAWRPLCRSNAKELVVDNHLEADAVVLADADLTQQILGNLLDNACKYSRDADDARVWLRARREGSSFILEVEDRGPGVPAEERRAIFRAFRRGSGHDVSGGVGLGLALAQRWATMLGGQLDLSAPEEGGACFRLTLSIA